MNPKQTLKNKCEICWVLSISPLLKLISNCFYRCNLPCKWCSYM